MSEKEKELPPFAEQLASQLGGIRGIVESGIPVIVFVLANVVFGKLKVDHALNWAIGSAVASALAIAAYRLYRKESVRHALNGLVGIAFGAYLAWKSGDAADFYLPGIILTGVYALAMIISVVVNKPVIGYAWSVLANGGKQDWLGNEALIRTFRWVTLVWAGIFVTKGAIQWALWAAHVDVAIQGVAKLAFGYPPWLLGVAITAWAVRRTKARMSVA